MSQPPPDGELKALRDQVAALNAKADKLADLAAESETPRPFLEKIKEVERKRDGLVAELSKLEADKQAADVLRAVSAKEVRALLAGLAEHLDTVDRAALKEMLAGIIEKIELDPATMTARIHYRVSLGNLRASPRLTQEPPLYVIRDLRAA